jgi:transposase
MTIKVRAITAEESEILDRWQRSDDVVRYRRARMLRLSEGGRRCPAIGAVLGLHVETVRWVIRAFNEGGIPAITPQPRSGGRPPSYDEAVGEAAEELVHQEPPAEAGRATWTLHGLAEAIAAGCDDIRTMSHEAVRRLLKGRDIVYRRAKKWLTSPDRLYTLRKSQRDRLLAWARAAPDGAAVWLDESWFVRWPYQFWAWAHKEDLPRVPQRWDEPVDTTALFATLEDETQEAYLSWSDGNPNSERMVEFLAQLMHHWTHKGKRFIVLLWDKASWHTSYRTRNWIRTYNRRAKRHNLTRLIVCKLPTRSPWLMPLESIFGSIKHQILGGRLFNSIAALQAAVDLYFHQRVTSARTRRDRAWAAALAAAAQTSRSVL